MDAPEEVVEADAPGRADVEEDRRLDQLESRISVLASMLAEARSLIPSDTPQRRQFKLKAKSVLKEKWMPLVPDFGKAKRYRKKKDAVGQIFLADGDTESGDPEA